LAYSTLVAFQKQLAACRRQAKNDEHLGESRVTLGFLLLRNVSAHRPSHNRQSSTEPVFDTGVVEIYPAYRQHRNSV
jgi:hypothetical protein